MHYDGITNEDMDAKTLRLTVLDEDKFGFDFIGEYRLPLKTLLRNELNEFYVALETKQEVIDWFLIFLLLLVLFNFYKHYK